MAESYLVDIVISRNIYTHSNGVSITTGLWATDDFHPQVHIFNTDCDLFLSLDEWQLVYKEFIQIGNYEVNENVNQYVLFQLIHCDKRCSSNIVPLVFCALNTFAFCVELRLRDLKRIDFVIAMNYVNKIKSEIINYASTINDIKKVIDRQKSTDSLIIEQEILVWANEYFFQFIF